MLPGDSMPSPFLYLLLLSSASGRWLGQTWGGAFKPIGINTIINNECIKRSTVHGFTTHKGPGSGQGEALARLLGEVAGPVTSRAVLALLRTSRGHGPIREHEALVRIFLPELEKTATQGKQETSLLRLSSCSQSELNSMEASLEGCVSKVQYQVRCAASSPKAQCLWVDLFLENCTDSILGRCFDPSSLNYIREQQERHLRRSKSVRRSCKSSAGEGGNFRDKLREKSHPLRVSYSDYLQSILSQL